jgi:uncharacterized membrane protein SirB2
MTYTILKTLHIASAIASFSLFFLRGIWSLNGSPIMRQRWVRIAPHVVDTLLLASAIALAYRIQQYPFVDAWLTAKVLALLLYIGMGFVALKYGETKRIRLYAWLAALAVFGYIASVALSHDPMPFIRRE